MGLAAMIADDLALVVDDTFAVTLTLFRSAGNTTVPITAAQRVPVGRNMNSYAGVLLSGDETIWHIPNNQVNPAANGREIRINDEITHGTTVYIVNGLTLAVLGTIWSCVCRNKL